MNISMCLEFMAVRSAKVLHSLVRLAESRSNPNSANWRECAGSHLPVMAARAARCALSSEWDWAVVRPECQTGQPYSSINLPSAFQYSTRVASGTPRALILLRAQVVLVALFTVTATLNRLVLLYQGYDRSSSLLESLSLQL